MKQVGCCTKCGTEVFEIVECFPDGHPLAGEPRRVGRMLLHGLQIEFQLSDGSLMPLAFCRGCADGLTPEDYPGIWDTVVQAWERTIGDEYRVAVGAKPWTEEMRKQYRREQYGKFILGRLWDREVDEKHENVRMVKSGR